MTEDDQARDTDNQLPPAQPVPPAYAETPSTPEQLATHDDTPAPRRRQVWPWALAAGLILVLIVAGFFAWRASTTLPLERAYESCKDVPSIFKTLAEGGGIDLEDADSNIASLEDVAGAAVNGVLSVEDNGKTLVVSTKSKDEDPFGFGSGLSLVCVYEVLETPTRVQESVATTRALDGRQSDSWGTFTAMWGYHPNSGLSMIISQE